MAIYPKTSDVTLTDKSKIDHLHYWWSTTCLTVFFHIASMSICRKSLAELARKMSKIKPLCFHTSKYRPTICASPTTCITSGKRRWMWRHNAGRAYAVGEPQWRVKLQQSDVVAGRSLVILRMFGDTHCYRLFSPIICQNVVITGCYYHFLVLVRAEENRKRKIHEYHKYEIARKVENRHQMYDMK